MKDELVVSDPGTQHGTSCSATAATSGGSDDADRSLKKGSHEHGGGCCDGHHHHHRHHRDGGDRTSLLGSILPLVACALCPACIGVWAHVLSVIGVGMVITETQHHVLLVIAITIAFLMSAFRFVRTNLVGPFVLTILGCASLAASHSFAEENHLLSWSSMAIILAASLWQRRAERNVRRLGSEPAFRRPPSEVA